MWSRALVVLLAAAVAGAADPPRKAVPAGSTWSLLAWGFPNGGKDETEGYSVVDLDIDEEASRIRQLKEQGITVICYFSVGTIEPWRTDMQGNIEEWRAVAVGEMADWDEQWLDVTQHKTLARLFEPRFRRAKSKGCDGVEPDNVDCYDNRDCWTNIKPARSREEVKRAQVAFNTWQAQFAHSLGLSIALKNANAIAAEMVALYDFAVTEQCQQYNSCAALAGFTRQNKAILNAEYTAAPDRCEQAARYSMATKYCDGDGRQGLCKSADRWTNCFEPGPITTQPPVLVPTWAPVPASLRPTASPTTSGPSIAPTRRPTRAPTLPAPQPTMRPTGSEPPEPITLRLRANATWANLAWGWANGGQDSTRGADAVIVDVDAPESEIRALRARGHVVICYFSAGTLEPKREDVQRGLEQWQRASVGRMRFWSEEWLDVTDLQTMQRLQGPRFVRAWEKGCQAVEPDNVDCFDNAACMDNLPGSPTRTEVIAAQERFNAWQVDLAHSLGLLIGLKNAMSLVGTMHELYDFAVVEQCQHWNECEQAAPFHAADKAVLHVEYGTGAWRCEAAAGNNTRLKYCAGSQELGRCLSGEWVDCFARGAGPEASPAPSSAPTQPLIELPAYPLAWANMAFGFVDDPAPGQAARAVGGDSPEGSLLVIVDLDDDPARIQGLAAAGHVVVCRFSAGAIEGWRPDVRAARATWDLAAMDGDGTVRGDVWLNVGKRAQLKDLVRPRFARAAQLGCNGVLPMDLDCLDHVGCRSAMGFEGLETREEAEPIQLPYNRWAAQEAARHGLLVGLHNCAGAAAALEPNFDFVLLDSCLSAGTCGEAAAFQRAGKPVLSAEVVSAEAGASDEVCAAAEAQQVSAKSCPGDAALGVCETGARWVNCFEPVKVTPLEPAGPSSPPPPLPPTTPESWLSDLSQLAWVGIAIAGAVLLGVAALVVSRGRRSKALGPPKRTTPRGPQRGPRSGAPRRQDSVFAAHKALDKRGSVVLPPEATDLSSSRDARASLSSPSLASDSGPGPGPAEEVGVFASFLIGLFGREPAQQEVQLSATVPDDREWRTPHR